MPNTPSMYYAEGMTVGQLAKHWQKPIAFVRGLVADGRLPLNERGVITHESLHQFMHEHGVDLD